MLRTQIKLVAVTLAVALAGITWDARAVHKNWVMKNSGSECVFTTPNSTYDQYFSYSIANTATYTRSVSCPVALAGRWGSSSPSTPIVRWSGAWAANIFVYNAQAGQTVSCSVRARLASGGYYYSRTASASSAGAHRLTPGYGGDWGGTLEGVETNDITSMDFNCSLPGNYSSISGYKVRICQQTSSSGPDCFNGFSTDTHGENTVVSNGDGYNWVQTSGIECKASNDSNVQRVAEGIKNTGTQIATIQCPIVPPAEDTNESVKDVDSVEIYFKGATAGETPACSLNWLDRFSNFIAGEDKWKTSFTLAQFPERLRLNSTPVRLDIGMAVYCWLPPGMTLHGITSRIEVAAVSGGG